MKIVKCLEGMKFQEHFLICSLKLDLRGVIALSPLLLKGPISQQDQCTLKAIFQTALSVSKLTSFKIH